MRGMKSISSGPFDVDLPINDIVVFFAVICDHFDVITESYISFLRTMDVQGQFTES
jgi:hypothetical protein